jgi:hypothetical protein
MKDEKISFAHFVEKFPEVDLPVTLTEESSRHFSALNEVLPALMIRQFILPFEAEAEDDLTEFVPCFRIPESKGFQALVYWKASLLTYDFVLITFTDKGEFIDKKIIAGTKAQGELLAQSVATIDEDWVIYVVGGVSAATSGDYDPTKSQSFQLELLPSGQIINNN